MKKTVLALVILAFSLAGCATQNAQITTARVMLTMHDQIKIGAKAADSACDQNLIKPEFCAEIKIAYDAFREEWPKTDDALKVYLQSPSETGREQFATHYNLFMSTYQQVFAALLKHGVIKLAEGGAK